MSKIIFDIGANNGESFERDIKNLANPNEYHLFEPTPYLFNILISKFADRKNVHLIEKAVSDKVGTAKFNIAGQNDWGCSSLFDFSDDLNKTWPGRDDFKVTETIEVGLITLKDYVEYKNINTIDFLHIDTQGNDLFVLKGLGDKISIVKEGVIEVANRNPLYKGIPGKDECIKFLEENGFRIAEIRSNDMFCNEENIRFIKI